MGYATYDEVKKAVLGDTQRKFDLGKDMQRIGEKAQDVDRLFKRFREQQTELSGEVTPADKQELRNRLKALEEELNHYLAGEYKIDPNNKNAYEKWFTSHKPFHWFIEFYGIMKSGGFDVAIGNPPYVGYNKIEHEYSVKGYQTEDANNLYALCVERTLSLVQKTMGFLSMIVPLSLSANDRLKNLRKLLMLRGRNWFAHFSSDTHPGTLFSGAQQNLCIFVNCSFSKLIVYTTDFIRFADSTLERESLFPLKINYIQSKPDLKEYKITKLGSILQYRIYEKLLLRRMLVAYVKEGSKDCVWYHDVVHYWCKCLLKPPFFKRSGEASSTSSHYKRLPLPASYKVILPTILSSSTFYFWHILKSNCRDLIKADVVSFPIELDRLSLEEKERLEDLSEELSKDLEYNKVRVTYQKKNADVIYDQYWPEKSKSIMDKIDKVLAKHYEFTDEELDFIINYDIKYRIGRNDREEE